MLRFMVLIDCTARTKKGHAPQSTTGEASSNWIQVAVPGSDQDWNGRPGIMSPMA